MPGLDLAPLTRGSVVSRWNKPIPIMRVTAAALTSGLVIASSLASAEPDYTLPYQVVQTAKVGGTGGFDYLFADAGGRRLYIPRCDRVAVFDLDSLKAVGVIPDTASVHGVTTDPVSHHGFSSSKPVVMWDAVTLKPIKHIPVDGSPDGILFEPASGHVFVFSHRTPNVTVIDAKEGVIVGTCDLGGAPEQAASDGRGRVYIDLEDQDAIAILDAHTLKVTARYPLSGHGGEPAGLALDMKNHVLFASCRNPATMVMLDAETGKILATLPIGAKTDGAVFNAATGEAFSSNRDGTLTVIKETGPAAFKVEENVATLPGARTCTLDAKTNRILLITAEYGPPPVANQPTISGSAPAVKATGPARAPMIPDSFTILAVGQAGS